MSDDEVDPIKKFSQHFVLLRQALGFFLDDPRFTVSVGGNPIMVDQMLTSARAIYEDTKF